MPQDMKSNYLCKHILDYKCDPNPKRELFCGVWLWWKTAFIKCHLNHKFHIIIPTTKKIEQKKIKEKNKREMNTKFTWLLFLSQELYS
jgi:hypothetical protein